ncbi:MAG TPA: methyl-accepting chemotaxis protein, partial [Terriglobales bacterium]
MKGRLNSTVAMLAGVNLVALFAVLYLAFSAGKSSAGEFDMSNPRLLGAAVLPFLVGVVIWWMLSSKFSTPGNQLAEFSEKVAAGDYKTRVGLDSPDDFGYIADNLNRASERASRAVFN